MKSMLMILLLGALALGGLVVPPEAAAAEAAVVDRIVAVVNEDVITLYDIETLMRPLSQNIKAQRLPPEREMQAVAKLRDEMLSNLIDTKTDRAGGQALQHHRHRGGGRELHPAAQTATLDH